MIMMKEEVNGEVDRQPFAFLSAFTVTVDVYCMQCGKGEFMTIARLKSGPVSASLPSP